MQKFYHCVDSSRECFILCACWEFPEALLVRYTHPCKGDEGTGRTFGIRLAASARMSRDLAVLLVRATKNMYLRTVIQVEIAGCRRQEEQIKIISSSS